MYIVDNVYVSDEVAEEFFICDLESCKGACCVEGDLGAPLDDNELPILDKIYPIIKNTLTAQANRAIKKRGLYLQDIDGGFNTTTIKNNECIFVVYDKDGKLKCGIEQAYSSGKIDFQKPISCHLYPIRITKLDIEEALNYDRWDICNCAIKKGTKHKLPIYQFLKEPLIRKYGEIWYQKLCNQIEKNEKAVQTDDF